MLGDQAEHQHAGAGAADLVLDVRLVAGELEAQPPADVEGPFVVLQDFEPPEHDHALDVQRPVARPGEALVIGAEGGFVAGLSERYESLAILYDWFRKS